MCRRGDFCSVGAISRSGCACDSSLIRSLPSSHFPRTGRPVRIESNPIKHSTVTRAEGDENKSKSELLQRGKEIIIDVLKIDVTKVIAFALLLSSLVLIFLVGESKRTNKNRGENWEREHFLAQNWSNISELILHTNAVTHELNPTGMRSAQ